MRLRPDPAVTADDLARGKRALVGDAAWATLAGSLYGGVILVGFALELGATPFIIGVLAAIPFLAQLAQLPAISLVERLRQRRKITVIAVTVSRTLILSLALLPFLEPQLALALFMLAQLSITLLGSVGGCSLNSWLHQLLPKDSLGELFAKRLCWSTVVASLGAAAAGRVIQHWPLEPRIGAYAAVFAAAAAAGFMSSRYLATVPEPEMLPRSGPPLPVLAMLRSPFKDLNFRRLIVFMGSWQFASNLAAPFLAVYLLRQLGFPLGTVTLLWVSSQVANALTMYLWGRISDRLSNKGILAVALPAYFGCLIGLPFTAVPEMHALTLPLLYVVHVVMGAAAGGIGLATGNLGLKLAPQGQGTAYLSSVSLAGAMAGGMAAITGGALADWFQARKLELLFHWTAPQGMGAATVLQFQHWEFLFAISFALGWYVLHTLSRIKEGVELSQRVVVQQFVQEAARSIDQLSSIAGLRNVLLYPFGWLSERRKRPRKPGEPAPRKGED
jgi:MFS family permease